MGQSTDGILCWGIELGIEDVTPAFLEEAGVDLITHCHHEYPMYIVIPRGCYVTAARGFPTEINTRDIIPSQSQKKAFTKWCKEHNIKGEPKLYLCSYWG